MRGSRALTPKFAALCAAFMLAAICAACGSSGTASTASTASTATPSTTQSAGTSTAASAGSSAVQQANAQIAQWAPTNPSVSVPALGKKVPTGKSVDYVTCPVPICVEVGQGVAAAAKALGWKFTLISGGLTPATFTAAWQQIAQNPPSAVVGVGLLPTTAIATELKTLIARKIPYVAITSPSPVGNGLTAVVSGPPEVARSGTLMADWVVANANGAKVQSVYVYDPSDTSIVPAQPAYQQRLAQLCPGCTASTLSVSAADIGTKIPGEVVSYVQSHPNLKYVVMGLGDLAAGIPEALKAAGVSSQVKLVTRVVDPTNFADVANGGIAAGFTEEGIEAGWRATDAVLRTLLGIKLESTEPIGVIHEISASDLPSNLKAQWVIPGYQAAYEQAWGLK
jgi:ABC-type sugar transport system substrate-binding protein